MALREAFQILSVGNREPFQEESPPYLTKRLTILFALSAGFTSANLSYPLPILHILAKHFQVSGSQIANVPALAQAGNATGLVLLLPLGDFLPRRNFVLVLMSIGTLLWYLENRLGLCLSENYTAFMVMTFLSAVCTPVTQLLLPLVSELSTSRTRAFNLSIMSTGPTLGIFIGRVISGIIADHTTWRNVYWLGLGLQVLMLILLFLFMPKYGSLNSISTQNLLKTYPQVLLSILTLYTKHPVLVQAGLMSFSTFFAVSSFWTTITFLLSGAPYHYNPAQIGLMGLIGLATIVAAPLLAKYVVQPVNEPLFSAAIGKAVSLLGIFFGTFLGAHSLAGPVLEAVFLDLGLTILQIANRVAIHPLEPQMRNRVNIAFVGLLYLGNLVGTKAGSVMYVDHGGWVPTGGLSIAVVTLGFVIIGIRGPNERRWIGWRGGWKRRSTDNRAN